MKRRWTRTASKQAENSSTVIGHHGRMCRCCRRWSRHRSNVQRTRTTIPQNRTVRLRWPTDRPRRRPILRRPPSPRPLARATGTPCWLHPNAVMSPNSRCPRTARSSLRLVVGSRSSSPLWLSRRLWLTSAPTNRCYGPNQRNRCSE